MLAILLTPIRTLLFGLAGAGLAWLWYAVDWWLPCLLVAIVFLVGMGVQELGEKALPDDPVEAVHWLKWRELSISILTAAFGALAIIIAVEIISPGQTEGDSPSLAAQKDALKEIVSAVAAALVAFFTALSVKPEDIDSSVGDHIRGQLQSSYGMIGGTPPKAVEKGRPYILLPKGSAALDAVYLPGEGWGKDARQQRAEELAKYLEDNSIKWERVPPKEPAAGSEP